MPEPVPALGASRVPLVEAHDLVMLDLDGVVYVGGEAVPQAAAALERARAATSVAYVTNNASRRPEDVAAHLGELGIPARTQDVVTSAQAAARVLVDRLGAGAPVLVLGAAGLRSAVEAEALVPVGPEEDRADEAVAVVTGYGPEVRWREVMAAAVRIRGGLWWVASNTDLTIPTADGVAPGHGTLVELLRRFSGVEPVVAGKPAAPLLEETVRRVGGDRPLMVGDRLDTDIEGAVGLGVPSLLVRTGVSTLPDLLAAPAGCRPTYLSHDLRGLLIPHPPVEVHDDAHRCGGWTARARDGRVGVEGDGEPDDWWRAVVSAAWTAHDAGGRPVAADGLEPPDQR